jgi:hypothetical protein
VFTEDGHINEIMDKAKQAAFFTKTITPSNSKEVIKYLRFWWSRHYNRPLKDPLLEEYSLYELFYEFNLYQDLDKPEVATEDAIKNSKDEIDKLVQEMTEDDKEFMDKEFSDQGWSMDEKDFQ